MGEELASAEQVEQRNKKVKTRRERELNDLAWVLSDPRGRRFIWRLLAECGVHRSTFSSDPLVMAKNAGQQNIGHFVEAEIVQTRETALLDMMREANEGGLNA